MKQLLVFLLLLCAASVSAQDVIVKKDGSTMVCRVVELTATEITYKKWSDLNGSNYVMERSAASAINYENGKREEFSDVQSQYLPGNQNDGVQQYNDRALLVMDEQSHPKKKRIFKWNIRAAISADYLTGGEKLTPMLGGDGGLGVLFPFKNSDFGLGADVSFASYGAKNSGDKRSCSLFAVGVEPYVCYKFPLSGKKAIEPFLGLYLNHNVVDYYARHRFRVDDSHSDELWVYEGGHLGLKIGAKMFVSESFYVDVYCKKGFSSDNRFEEEYGPQYEKEYHKLSALKLSIGVGFEF